MTYEAGSVVMLKSGGQPMTVVAASGDDIDCVWIGEEGEFFRHTIPAVALEAAISEDDEEEEDEEEEGEEVAEEEEEEDTKRAERAA
jgi:uncharacterized protein YodC (DUF2158 family)